MNTPEIEYLVYTVLLTGTLWVPVIANRILEQGLWKALKHPQAEVPPKSLWGKRAVRAHMNGVENLVIFAPLVLAVVFSERSSDLTADLVLGFFALRVAHYLAYMFAVPLIRTVLFVCGWGIQVSLGLVVLIG